MSSLYERIKSIRANTGKRVIVTNIKEYFSGDAHTTWFQDVMRGAPAQPTPVEVAVASFEGEVR